MKERQLTPAQRKYFRQYRPRNTDRDWDVLRMKVPDLDILALPIAPLYMEVFGRSWPGKRRQEPISSYFDMNYDELVAQCGMKPKEIDLMMDLVFQVVAAEKGEKEMVRQERITDQTNDFFLRTLEKFGIRPELPIDFIALNEESLSFCGGSSVDDLESLLRKSVELSDKKVLSGELQDLVNAVATESPQLMARFLPIVPGERGVQPWKAMSIVVEKIPRTHRSSLDLYFTGKSPKVSEESEAEFKKLCQRLEMLSLEFRALFPNESRSVREDSEEGEASLAAIQDPNTRSLARCVIRGRQSDSGKSHEPKSRKSGGLMRGILGRVGVS